MHISTCLYVRFTQKIRKLSFYSGVKIVPHYHEAGNLQDKN